MPNPGFEQNLKELKALSARLGSDPLQVQGAGGNTSMKSDGKLWIKASGKWLANAESEELFVPVALNPLLQALQTNNPQAEKSTDFIVDELNPTGLRPSIETTVHAVLTQRFVIHTHCVDTIAIASQSDAKQQLDSALEGFKWLWVPYLRPGLPLSKYISQNQNAQTDVIILGNHGLVVAADSIDDAEKLMLSVRAQLKQKTREHQTANTRELIQYCENSDYLPAIDPLTHGIALDQTCIDIAAAGSLYPDHVIFLGDATKVAAVDEPLDVCVNRMTDESGESPTSIVVPGKGVLLKKDANAGQQAMARCIYDVSLRLTNASKINYLKTDDVFQLLNWEAEQYRQQLNVNG